MNGLIQEGIIPFTTGGAPPAETFHILAETGDNLTAEDNNLLTQE